jgi:hypothetical protein
VPYATAAPWQCSSTESAIRNSATQRFDHAQRLRLVSGYRTISADLLPDVLDVDQGRDGADLGVLRAL